MQNNKNVRYLHMKLAQSRYEIHKTFNISLKFRKIINFYINFMICFTDIMHTVNKYQINIVTVTSLFFFFDVSSRNGVECV